MTIILTSRARIAKLFRFNYFCERLVCNIGTLLLPYSDRYGLGLHTLSGECSRSSRDRLPTLFPWWFGIVAVAFFVSHPELEQASAA